MKNLPLFALAVSLIGSSSLIAAERMALVIGNGAYTGSPLPNPPSDAKLVAEALSAAGFVVTQKTDLALDAFRTVLDSFQNAAREGRASAVAVYYAGHGIEAKGQNYLVPVDADITAEYQVASRTLPMGELMGALDSTQAPLKIVVLDCCRDNPLGRSFRRSSASSGLAALTDTPDGTIIAYATSPGKTALDGDGKNSPFAAAFASALKQPGLTAEDVFKTAIGQVKQVTKNEQKPWLSLNYEGKFYFLPGSAQPVALAKAHSVPSMSDADLQRRIEEEVRKRMQASPSAISNLPSSPSAPFTNSLGMKFVPVPGNKVLFCIHETRNADYAAYAAASSGVDTEWKSEATGKEQHPVVNVSWEDAQAFCKWLSAKEGKTYRLPTDHEWSMAVGIGSREDASESPESKHGKITSVYPWGGDFPPGPKDGNYDVSDVTDGYQSTAPVMQFKANTFGLYDLGGNVWEWCEDKYSDSSQWRVLRGGSWYGLSASSLVSAFRGVGDPSDRLVSSGFRLVLVVGSGG